jgi:hypothetical protein
MAGIGGIVAAFCVLMSACTPPEVQGAFDAWKANDRAAASTYMTPKAVDQLWSAATWSEAADWQIVWCSPKEQFADYTPDGPPCAWGDRNDNLLITFQDPTSHEVYAVMNRPSVDPVSGRVFAAWRRGDRAAAAPYLTPSALATLFAIPRDPNIFYGNGCYVPDQGLPVTCDFVGNDFTKPIIEWKHITWTRPADGSAIADVAWTPMKS